MQGKFVGNVLVVSGGTMQGMTRILLARECDFGHGDNCRSQNFFRSVFTKL
jgi:hypothetical protein